MTFYIFIWSYDLGWENNLIMWSKLWCEIRKNFDRVIWDKKNWSRGNLIYEKKLDLVIWDTKIIWFYDLRYENNLICDQLRDDLLILISPDFVIAWFWSGFFLWYSFLYHFFCDLVILISKILWSCIFWIILFDFPHVSFRGFG